MSVVCPVCGPCTLEDYPRGTRLAWVRRCTYCKTWIDDFDVNVQSQQEENEGAYDRQRAAIETEKAITLVCEIAFAWAGEYGFSNPEEATKVWNAAKLLRPDLEPRP